MKAVLSVAAVLGLFVVVACGDDDEKDVVSSPTDRPTAGATDAGTEVGITLQEFSVIPDADSVEAGDVTFNVQNVDPDDVHEFVIFKTALEPEALPTLDDGSVDEEGAGLELIDAINGIPVDSTESLTTNLATGAYVFICNIYDETEDEAHYAEGMYTAFTVE